MLEELQELANEVRDSRKGKESREPYAHALEILHQYHTDSPAGIVTASATTSDPDDYVLQIT